MSITTSQEERDQAIAKLEARSDVELREDLAFWAVAVADHEATFERLSNERNAAVDLYREAQAWVGLVTVQLQKRRRRVQ